MAPNGRVSDAAVDPMLGFVRNPIDLSPDTIPSRRDKNTARLCNQHVSEKRIARYPARWLAWALAFSSGSAFAGNCPNTIEGTYAGLDLAVFSACEALETAVHAILIKDTAGQVRPSVGADLIPYPGVGGVTPPHPFGVNGLYVSSSGDACESITYPLTPPAGGSLPAVAGSNYCFVVTDAVGGASGGREQRISAQWDGAIWKNYYMTDTLIPWTVTTSTVGDGTAGGGGPHVVTATVNLSHMANPGSTFAGWTGDAVCADMFIMPDEDVSCTANFTLDSHGFATATAGTGSGNTTGSTANGTYDYNTVITLVATADPGSTFSGWSPAACVDGFSLQADTDCTANFSLNSHSVTIGRDGSGAGTVTGGGSYFVGDTVNLIVTPDQESYFQGWGGDSICGNSFIMPDRAVICTAIFANVRPIPVMGVLSMAALSVLLGLAGFQVSRRNA